MSAKRRIANLERISAQFDETEEPVTFVEMAHGIRDHAWRHGKSRSQLLEARRELLEASARFREFFRREVLRDE